MISKQTEKLRRELILFIKTTAMEKGMSDAIIGNKIGKPRQTISNMLSGNYPVGLDNLIKICDVVGLKIDIS